MKQKRPLILTCFFFEKEKQVSFCMCVCLCVIGIGEGGRVHFRARSEKFNTLFADLICIYAFNLYNNRMFTEHLMTSDVIM